MQNPNITSKALMKTVMGPKRRTWEKVLERWNGLPALIRKRSDGAWFFVRPISGDWQSDAHKNAGLAYLDTYLLESCTCSIRMEGFVCPVKVEHLAAFRKIEKALAGRVKPEPEYEQVTGG